MGVANRSKRQSVSASGFNSNMIGLEDFFPAILAWPDWQLPLVDYYLLCYLYFNNIDRYLNIANNVTKTPNNITKTTKYTLHGLLVVIYE